MGERGPIEAQGVPWLVELAVRQRNSGPDTTGPVYDEVDQMTYVRIPVRMLAIDSDATIGTKKADRETGEDQKGF